MDPIVGGALIGAGTGLLGDLFNFGQQRRNLDYQKHLQREVFNREDNAVQRRVADLRAAGLSPTLAAGSAAASGATISTTAPQMPKAGERAREAIMGALEMRAMNAGLRKVQAEIGWTEADTRRANAEAAIAEARVPYASKLAEWYASTEESRSIGSMWERGTRREEFFMAGMKRDLMDRFGMREREAETIIREIESRVAGKAEEFGAGPAKGITQWIPLLQAILSAAGR